MSNITCVPDSRTKKITYHTVICDCKAGHMSPNTGKSSAKQTGENRKGRWINRKYTPSQYAVHDSPKNVRDNLRNISVIRQYITFYTDPVDNHLYLKVNKPKTLRPWASNISDYSGFVCHVCNIV